MSRITGRCFSCDAKIGRRTANGAYRHNSNMRQISLILGHKGSRKETAIHVPVCTDCLKKPNLEKIKEYLKTDGIDEIFKTSEFRRHEIDPIQGGVLTEVDFA